MTSRAPLIYKNFRRPKLTNNTTQPINLKKKNKLRAKNISHFQNRSIHRIKWSTETIIVILKKKKQILETTIKYNYDKESTNKQTFC